MTSWRIDQSSADETVAHLQEAIIKAVTLGQRLPGLDKPVIIPPQCSVNSRARRPLLTDNLSPLLDLGNLPDVLSIMTPDEYQSTSSGNTNDWYLTFQPPHVSTSRIRLVISALKGLPCNDPPPVEIGNLQAEFHFTGGRWEAIGMPNLYIRDTH